MSARWIAVFLLAAGCRPEIAHVDGDAMDTTGSSGSPMTTEPLEDASTGSSSTGQTVATESSSTSTGDASEGESSGTTACDPIVPGGFNECLNGTVPDATLCNWNGTSESVGYVGCLQTAYVEGSVCMIQGCVDACDCFAPPATGTASVECLEGIIANDTACVLYCFDGQVCPDGMVCAGDICAWEVR
jgi:hypothetical protein